MTALLILRSMISGRNRITSKRHTTTLVGHARQCRGKRKVILMATQSDKEDAERASEAVVDAIELMRDLGVDPDYAAFLLLSAGFGLAIVNNRESPIVVNELLAGALATANRNILDAEEEEEEEEDDDEESGPKSIH